MLREEIVPIIRKLIYGNREDIYNMAPYLLDLVTLTDDEFDAEAVLDYCNPFLNINIISDKTKELINEICAIAEKEKQKEVEAAVKEKKKAGFSFSFER